jgi:hypothetical protein
VRKKIEQLKEFIREEGAQMVEDKKIERKNKVGGFI